MKKGIKQTLKKYSEFVNNLVQNRTRFNMNEGMKLARAAKIDNNVLYIMRSLGMLIKDGDYYTVRDNLYINHAMLKVIQHRNAAASKQSTVRVVEPSVVNGFNESEFKNLVKQARTHGWNVTAYKETRIEI